MQSLFRTAAAACAAGLFALATGGWAEPAPVLHLESIRVQLLYTSSGTLSEDVAPPADFSLFNTVIGEGSAAEPANDFLVGVLVTSPSDQANGTVPLVVTVKDAQGKVLARRTFSSIFVDDHRSVSSVFVPDATCAGAVTVEAVMGAQKLKTRLDFVCGE